MLGRAEAVKLVKDELFPQWSAQRDHLDRIDAWYRWQQEEITLPRGATAELRHLAELSKVPWLGLVVTAAAQAMYVDGFRSALDVARDAASETDEDRADESPPWRTWLVNAMDRRQVAIHRAMLAYGISYATVLPGRDPLTGDQQAVIRGVSPRKMLAVYEDPAEDDWPTYALRIVSSKGDDHLVRLYDEDAVHTLRVGYPSTVTYEGVELHRAGVTPVVRYCNQLDLDGRTPGEVEPFIPLAAKINKTSYDRMLVQHYNSWKVRYVTGMSEPDDAESANREKLRLRQDDILIAEDPDTKFGQLDETQLQGFIAAHKADIETLAAASQTPTHELTGVMINVSADALAASRANLHQKITERQKTAGAAHAQTLKLAAALDGHDDYARDHTARVTWQDMDIRSMSQAADALVKLSTMGVPLAALWAKIPGVERSDVDEWVAMAAEGDPIRRMQLQLEAEYSGTGSSSDTAGVSDLPAPENLANAPA